MSVLSRLGTFVTGVGAALSARIRPSREDARQLGGKVAGPVNLWEQTLWAQGAVTPQRMSEILRQVDQGHIREFVDLVHSYRRKDGHLHNCISIFEAQVGGGKWIAIPQSAQQNPRKSELKQSRILEAIMAELVGWPAALAHLASEPEQFGHGTVELVWGMYDGDNPLLHGWFVPRVAYRVDTRRFGFRTIDGKLLFDPVGMGYVDDGGVDLDEFPAGKFITHRVRVNGDVEVREGAGQVTAWLAIFRNWCLRVWMQYGEQSWKPYRIATYHKQNSDPKDIAVANEIVERLLAGGGAAKSDAVDLEITWPKFASSQGVGQHHELFETMGMELTKAWLGHSLLTESGARGARSLGEVGWDVSRVRKLERTMALAVTLYQRLVKPIFAINSPGKRAPFWVPDLGETADIQAFGAGLKAMIEAGMPIQTSWVRTQLRVPAPQPGEEMLNGSPKPEPGASSPPKDEVDEGAGPDTGADDAEAEPGESDDQDGD